jgi:hypothetical protein
MQFEYDNHHHHDQESINTQRLCNQTNQAGSYYSSTEPFTQTIIQTNQTVHTNKHKHTHNTLTHTQNNEM